MDKQQSVDQRAGAAHGIIAPGFTATRDSVQVASIQTISRKPEAFGAFDLIIIDEGHHSVAGQYARLIAAQPTAKLLGVTAIPERADGRGLGVQAGGCFDDLVLGPSIAALVHSLDRIRNDFSPERLCNDPLATDGFRASGRQHPVQNRHTNSGLSSLSSEAAGA